MRWTTRLVWTLGIATVATLAKEGTDQEPRDAGVVPTATTPDAAVVQPAKKKSTSKRQSAAYVRWRGRRVVVLYRGVHYGSYKGRGRAVTVDANADAVIENHAAKLVGPLRTAGANVTVVACTYGSPVLKAWLARAQVDAWEVLDKTTSKGKPRAPNDLILAAYDFVLRKYGTSFDTLVSVRADILLKRTLLDATATVAFDRLGFPWKEANGIMSKRCMYRETVDANSRACYDKWLKNGERFADALVLAPRHAVADLRFGIARAMSFKVLWDQHSVFQHLKKQRGYTVLDNVSTMVKGFWNSNPNTHANPLFSLARKKHMASRGGHHAVRRRLVADSSHTGDHSRRRR